MSGGNQLFREMWVVSPTATCQALGRSLQTALQDINRRGNVASEPAVEEALAQMADGRLPKEWGEEYSDWFHGKYLPQRQASPLSDKSVQAYHLLLMAIEYASQWPILSGPSVLSHTYHQAIHAMATSHDEMNYSVAESVAQTLQMRGLRKSHRQLMEVNISHGGAGVDLLGDRLRTSLLAC
jgi:hypothetical protein